MMTESSTAFEVVHEPERSRFAVRSDGTEAVLEYQKLADKVVFAHTGVPRALEGRGAGGALARAGLEWARGEGLRVIPICPFVSSYIRRHPEYAELVQRGGEA